MQNNFRHSPLYILTPTNRETRALTPKHSPIIIRSTTPPPYHHVPKVYICKTPQNSTNLNQNHYISLKINENTQDRRGSFFERSMISTEPTNKSFTNKSSFNQKTLEEDNQRFEKENRELKKENEELRQKMSQIESQSLQERQKYEEKLLSISSELNKRLLNEKNHRIPSKETTLYEKLIDEMRNEHDFAMETLQRDHKRSTQMYEMLIKEMEGNVNELLKKNGMLNLSVKELEKKNRELQLINKNLNKRNIQLESERLG